MKRLLAVGFVAASLGLLTSPLSFATSTSDNLSTPYTYGAALNIAKVISIDTPQTIDCEIVQSKMTYLDYVGVQRTIMYQVHSDACSVGD